MSVDNLKRVFDQATAHEIEIGLDAYATYNRIMVKLAQHCATTPCVASAVFSALSRLVSTLQIIRPFAVLLPAILRVIGVSCGRSLYPIYTGS